MEEAQQPLDRVAPEPAAEDVAASYGWPADRGDEEILRRLFELNQARAVVQGSLRKVSSQSAGSSS